jgi:hypothetical protein
MMGNLLFCIVEFGSKVGELNKAFVEYGVLADIDFQISVFKTLDSIQKRDYYDHWLSVC